MHRDMGMCSLYMTAMVIGLFRHLNPSKMGGEKEGEKIKDDREENLPSPVRWNGSEKNGSPVPSK